MLPRLSLAIAVTVQSVLLGCLPAEATTPNLESLAPAEQLASVIRGQQTKHVRESTGVESYECFTDNDLTAFLANKVPAKAVAQVRASKDYATVLASLRSLPADSLETVFRSSRQIARPTWAMMGYIDRTGHGQTDAGHTADLKIAEAITNAFAEALR